MAQLRGPRHRRHAPPQRVQRRPGPGHRFTARGRPRPAAADVREERAAERGEVPTADLPERIVTLPTDLLRHEIVLSDRPVTDAALEEIVDDVLLPLVTGRG
ncbi:TetR-like C-terminal domain-containing protein [Streptomyces hokutonensis]|uniref:TetR-like C-terminal domain-containing protein n=1 Tax=Streptomyces hokutonensis TaxID=1306990 RepID=UPI0036B33C9F